MASTLYRMLIQYRVSRSQCKEIFTFGIVVLDIFHLSIYGAFTNINWLTDSILRVSLSVLVGVIHAALLKFAGRQLPKSALRQMLQLSLATQFLPM